MHDTGKHFIAIASLVSFAVFLSAFVATFVSRPAVEDAMSGFVRDRVHQEVRERVGSLVGADAAALQRWYQDSAASTAEFVEHDFIPFVDAVLDSLSGTHGDDSPTVDRARRFAEMGRDALQREVDSHAAIAAQLEAFIRGKYTELVDALVSEVRIFSGINAALFACALALLVARWRDPTPVILPAALLLLATAACTLVYIFHQNWFFSILLQDYPGYGYLAYVSIVFALLLDIAFNKARVTKLILDALSSVLTPA